MINEELTKIATIDEALSFMDRVFGYDQFRPGQEEIVGSVLEGGDTLVIMPRPKIAKIMPMTTFAGAAKPPTTANIKPAPKRPKLTNPQVFMFFMS